MYKRNNIVLGLVLVLLGILFLSKNIFNINLDVWHLVGYLWPALFLLLPSLIMHSGFFASQKRDAGILVPAGILLVTGVTCQLGMLFNVWDLVWPGFIYAVAVGLFELYLFGGREPGLLVPVGILSVSGLTCQISMMFNAWDIMWPGFIFAVAVGLFLLYTFGEREKGLLIPVSILGGLSAIFFMAFSLRWLYSSHIRQMIISVVLILVGVIVIYKNSSHRKDY